MDNKKYFVTELFYSIQGEGRHVGKSSVFIRLFGCNLTCQGFGMPEGELSNERENVVNLIETTDITSLEELPLVKTGCDSYAAWDKRFRHLSKQLTIEEIREEILKTTPDYSMDNIDLVVTGGEPMLQQKLIFDICSSLKSDGLNNVTIETNGTLPTKKYIEELSDIVNLHFSVSLKLKSSGEPDKKRINWKSLVTYFDFDSNYISDLKFVIRGNDDIKEINYILATLDEIDDGHERWIDFKTKNKITFLAQPKVFLMPTGGCQEEYNTNKRMVADIVMSKPQFTYTPRLHIDLFGNEWAT